MEVTKKFRFEMAHILSNYDGLCGNLHGHSYECLVTFQSDVLEDGMVCDFSKIKALVKENIIDKMDHSFAYNSQTTDAYEKAIVDVEKAYNKRMVAFPFRTTAENMATYIGETINELLKDTPMCGRVVCSHVQLFETTTGCAYWSLK